MFASGYDLFYAKINPPFYYRSIKKIPTQVLVTYDSGQQLAPNCEYQNRNFLHRHIRNLEFLDFRRVLQKPVYLRYHSRKDLLLILMPNRQLIMIQPLG